MSSNNELHVSSETVDILLEYKDCTLKRDFLRRLKLKVKAYQTELTSIRAQLLTIPNFDKLLNDKNFLQAHIGLYSLTNSKSKYSTRRIINERNPTSLINRYKKFLLKTIYKSLLNEKIPVLIIEKLLNLIDPFIKTNFQALTDVHFDVFDYIKLFDKKRRNK